MAANAALLKKKRESKRAENRSSASSTQEGKIEPSTVKVYKIPDKVEPISSVESSLESLDGDTTSVFVERMLEDAMKSVERFDANKETGAYESVSGEPLKGEYTEGGLEASSMLLTQGTLSKARKTMLRIQTRVSSLPSKTE